MDTKARTDTLAQRLEAVQSRIRAACTAAGRSAKDVHLLAVSKTFHADAVREAAAAGQRAFGENYIAEAVGKITALADVRVGGLPLEWHCIGPIQSNKTRLVAEHFDWAHTVDRLKIAERLSEQRPAHLPPLMVCVQVNVDGAASKSGVAPDEALALIQAVAALPRLRLRGLMCIPDPAPDAEMTSKFIATKSIFTWAKSQFDEKSDPTPQFDTLSMGMSADLEPAVSAGSSMVRVGTAVFGARG